MTEGVAVDATPEVTAAYATDEGYEAKVVSRVKVSPDVWVCSHEDGTVSLKLHLNTDAAREWADAFGEMADEASEQVDEPEPVAAAAGKDVTPGNDNLHHFWTKGEGLARWVESPTPWTTLVALLTKHVGATKAKVFASKWHKEVFGIWVGEKAGKNPLGPG